MTEEQNYRFCQLMRSGYRERARLFYEALPQRNSSFAELAAVFDASAKRPAANG